MARGTANRVVTTYKMNRLSTLRLYSVRYPAKNWGEYSVPQPAGFLGPEQLGGLRRDLRFPAPGPTSVSV
ncbi:hypothetical protein GCM10029978_028340 [Actinoallomurus acanthiterrae]